MTTVVADLRRTRRTRRLGDVEWFDVAYRAYLAAFLGGLAVILLSDLVGDDEVVAEQLVTVAEQGPAAIGLVGAIAVAVGLRGGAEGGPLSIEAADVRHLLLAPVPRRSVLLRPYAQRLRAVAFGAAVAGGIAGLLAAQRLPGSPVAWITSGAVTLALVGGASVGIAALAHAARLPRALASAIGAALVAVQATTALGATTGPFDTVGSLAMWGWRQDAADVAVVVVAVAVMLGGALVLGRFRLEPLVRRGDLVSQLRFAVTTQDLRTIVLLRRQLGQERPRGEPWFGLGPPASHRRGRRADAAAAIRRRAWRGLARTPAPRIARTAALGAVGGLSVVLAIRDVTPALIGTGVLAFLIGLELTEPLSQEIDHPDRTDEVPVTRGWIHLRLLGPSAVAAIVPAGVAVAVIASFEPGAAAAAAALALPVTWIGVAGAAVSVVRDAPDPTASEQVLVPPEMAGINQAVRALVPVVVGGLGAIAVWAVREQPGSGMVVRMVIGSMLVLGLVGYWVQQRDDMRRTLREFFAQGRAAR